jgi:hypothetical protein
MTDLNEHALEVAKVISTQSIDAHRAIIAAYLSALPQPEGDEVERIARAIHAAQEEHYDPPQSWDNASDMRRQFAEFLARAAISAMRPAGVAELVEALGDLVSWFTEPVIEKRVWLIPAGERGADDAVDNARAALSRLKEQG